MNKQQIEVKGTLIGWNSRGKVAYYHKLRNERHPELSEAKCRRIIDSVNRQGIPPFGYECCPVCFGAIERRAMKAGAS